MTDKATENTWLKKLSDIGKAMGIVIAIQGALFAIAKPHIDDYIDARFEDSFNSPSFQIHAFEMIDTYLESAEFSAFLERTIHEYEEKDSQRVKLRTLLAQKMDVDEDEVHIEQGKMYKNYINIKNRVNSIIREIHYYHDDSILKEE